MLVSFCIPSHNRLDDLRQALPRTLAAAQECPPAEVCVVDYASTDGTGDYLAGLPVVSRHYSGRDYYHMAHARNLSARLAMGAYIVILSADIYVTPDFLPYVRPRLPFYTWMYDERYRGVIVCKRQEFIDAGGYDERFEFYGPEDKELHMRLVRRGGKVCAIPSGMVKIIPTPDDKKVQGYRLPLSKRQMHERGLEVLNENNAREILRANPGGWGQW